MRSVVRGAFLPVAALVGLLSGPAHAAPSSATAGTTSHVAAPSAEAPSAGTVLRADARVGVRAGVPWLRIGPARSARAAVRPDMAVLEARARQLLASATTSARSADLVLHRDDRFADGDAILHFGQMHRGLPVVGRGATVRFAERGAPILTGVDLEADLPGSVVPSRTAQEAADAAARIVPSLSPFARALARKTTGQRLDGNNAHLVVWPTTGGGARLAYVVLPQVPTGMPTAPRIVVDAETGAILEARDLVRFAQGRVFPQNPTKTTEAALETFALDPNAGSLENGFLTSHNCIDKKRVTPVSMFGFNANVHVCDLVTATPTMTSGDGEVYDYPPSDVAGSVEARSDTFSEVSMYYHAAKAYEFFRALGGTPEAQVVEDKPLRVIANLQLPAGLQTGDLAAAGNPDLPLETFSNAFFSPAQGGLGDIFQTIYGLSGGGLWFGQGPQRDYAYDGDVVYHEFTHAVVDATLKLGAWHLDARGAIDAPGAMNEGIADYFSSAITGDPNVGEYASKDLSTADVIRTLDNRDRCPENVSGEVHADSTLFSGALWQARASLPEGDRSKFDTALYKAMKSNPGRGDLGYDDLAKLFQATLATDLPAGATALETAMTERGVFPSCERIVEFGGGTVRPTNERGYTSPGTATVGVSNLAPGVIQIHAKVPDGASSLTVTFPSSGGGGGGLGGGTPFTPVVVAKFGQPITWSYAKGTANHDGDVSADATGEGTAEASIALPEGTKDVYVQIANSGQSDGSYTAVDLVFDVSPSSQPSPPPTETSGTANAPQDDASGCGCAVPGRTGASAPLAAFVGVAAAVLGMARRRRARMTV